MTTKLILYLLAILTGISVAEAARPVSARPVSAMPTSVGAATATAPAYAEVMTDVAEQIFVRPLVITPISVVLSVRFAPADAFAAIIPATPVLRHDVILG